MAQTITLPEDIQFLTDIEAGVLSAAREAMRRVDDHSRRIATLDPAPLWYDDQLVNLTFTVAEKAGFIRRLSVTQVQWTEAGATLARQQIERGRVR